MESIPDVHCHLASLPDPASAVREAMQAGVGPILAVGMERRSSRHGLELRAQFPAVVLAAVGVHPSEIPGMEEPQLQQELAFVEQELLEADALGEVGLDYKDATDARQRERQMNALRSQLEWAERLRKPVNLHCRRAERDLMRVASDFARRTGLGVDLHWFTHSHKLARECAAAGLFISAGPSILHSLEQARVAAQIDPDLLLLETDSPVEYAGEPASPAWALRVATRLAELRGESLEALARRLQANLRRYLGASPGS